jgi:hypothetical protein
VPSWDRVRVRHDFEDTEVSWKLGPDQPSSSTWEYYNSTVVRPGKYSRIKDMTGYATSNGSYVQKDCEHYHVTPRAVADPADWERAWSWYPRPCVWLSPERFTPIRVDQLTHYWFPPSVPTSVLRDFAQEALKKFTTQIPEEVSIANFLWELREIGAMVPKIADNLFATGANSFLTYEFGIAPFLDDLEKLASLNRSVNKRLAYLRKTRNKPTRLGHYKRNAFTLDREEIPYDEGFPGWHGLIHTHGSCQTILRAGCKFTHNIDWLDSVHGKMRAFGSALGLGNPIKAFWEALPFSFFVDWFVDVGGMLDNLDLQDETAGWRVWDLNWSVSLNWVDEIYQRSFDYEGELVLFLHTLDLKSKFYTRASGYPELGFLETLDPSSLNPKQQALFIALVLASLSE